MPEQHDQLRSLAQEALDSRGNGGFGAVLPHLLDFRDGATRNSPEPEVLLLLLGLQQALRRGDPGGTLSHIQRLLGFGPGLTPSGDDVVIGLVLLLSRWGDMLRLDDGWQDLSSQIVDAGYDRTTTLSANLIELAFQGQSDERVVAVVDSIVTGVPAWRECVRYLLAWGSSSGIDALVGMAVGLTSQR